MLYITIFKNNSKNRLFNSNHNNSKNKSNSKNTSLLKSTENSTIFFFKKFLFLNFLFF